MTMMPRIAPPPLVEPPGRLDRVGSNVALALRLLRCVNEPGHQPPSQIADDLGLILRARLGERERQFLASAVLLALDPDARLTAAEDVLGIPAWEASHGR